MDANRFDRWTKTLLAPRTRRGTLRVAAGVAAGLAWLGRAEDAAACKKAGAKCKKSKQCCSKKCKGKKCRCTPLKGSCPGSGADHVCCPNPGATVGCSFMFNKALQCGPNGFRCLRGIDSPCSDNCQCAGELQCGGAPDTRCCTGLGKSCTEGPGESQCCSQQCGCTAPGSCTCRFANCKSPGESCSLLHTQCCDGVCSSGECCLPLGIACTSTAQCCGALVCNAGFCATP